MRNRAIWMPPGTEAPEEWGGEVELALFRSSTLVEAAFLLRGPHALLLADAAFKMDASCGAPPGEIWQARLWGSIARVLRVSVHRVPVLALHILQVGVLFPCKRVLDGLCVDIE